MDWLNCWEQLFARKGEVSARAKVKAELNMLKEQVSAAERDLFRLRSDGSKKIKEEVNQAFEAFGEEMFQVFSALKGKEFKPGPVEDGQICASYGGVKVTLIRSADGLLAVRIEWATLTDRPMNRSHLSFPPGEIMEGGDLFRAASRPTHMTARGVAQWAAEAHLGQVGNDCPAI